MKPKKFGQKSWVRKKCWVKKTFWPENILARKNFGLKKFCSEKLVGRKKISRKNSFTYYFSFISNSSWGWVGMQELLFNVGDWMAGCLGGRVIIVPLCGLSCKQRLSRFSAELKFQDKPSVVIFYLVDNICYDFMTGN